MSERKLDEFERIARHFAPLAAAEPGAFALADDAAVIAVDAGCRLVVTTDTMVAGIHFRPQDPPEVIAAKLLRTNLSDLAAMGARPAAYTLSAALNETVDTDWLDRFCRGLADDQARFALTLIGGDTVATPGPLTLTLTALGSVGEGRELRRSVAVPGDTVYVSGTVGDAALGLKVVEGALSEMEPERARELTERYHCPWPRVSLGLGLAGVGHAVVDVSDGLVADLGHICDASGVDATIEAADVPLSDAARAAVALDGTLMLTVLAGGDDYELLITAPRDSAAALQRISGEAGVPLTAIGRIFEGKGAGVRVLDAVGREIVLGETGYRHSWGTGANG